MIINHTLIGLKTCPICRTDKPANGVWINASRADIVYFGGICQDEGAFICKECFDTNPVRLYRVAKDADGLSPDKIIRNCEICGQGYAGREIFCWRCSTPVRKWRYSIVRSNNSRAKELGLEASLTFKQWVEILESHNYQCHYCSCDLDKDDRTIGEQLEHVIPIFHGGGTTASNVVPSCKTCNLKKGIALIGAAS